MNAIELAAHAGITYRQVDLWSNAGWLRPLNQGAGTGRRREYPAGEVAVAVRMGRLVKVGLTANVAARVARGDEAAVKALREALEAA